MQYRNAPGRILQTSKNQKNGLKSALKKFLKTRGTPEILGFQMYQYCCTDLTYMQPSLAFYCSC